MQMLHNIIFLFTSFLYQPNMNVPYLFRGNFRSETEEDRHSPVGHSLSEFRSAIVDVI